LSELCPCSSGLDYSACCMPFLRGDFHAPTPATLMRSRYSAYVKHDADYLISTWHPDCNAEQWREAITQNFSQTEWLGLAVRDSSITPAGDQGYVEFVARYRDKDADQPRLLHENSRFLQIGQRWYYVDGKQPVTGRNDLCLCGSTKKYKKCCGR